MTILASYSNIIIIANLVYLPNIGVIAKIYKTVYGWLSPPAISGAMTTLVILYGLAKKPSLASLFTR